MKNTPEEARYYAIKFLLDDMIKYIDEDKKTIEFYDDGNNYLYSKGYCKEDRDRYVKEKFEEMETKK